MGFLQDSLAAKREKRFGKLPKEWREEAEGASTDELKDTIRNCAMNSIALAEAKKVDTDLHEAQARAATAAAPYREGAVMNSTKIEFAMETLKGRGEPIPNIDDFLKQDAESE